MSPLAIVATSAFSVLFLILLIAAASAVVYTHILLRREIANFSLLIKSTETKMDLSYNRIETLVASIHGDKIRKASEEILSTIPRLVAVAKRNETVALLIIDTINHVRGEEGIPESALNRARESGLLPEDYAPSTPGEHYISRSRTSIGDSDALADEASENSHSSFPGDGLP